MKVRLGFFALIQTRTGCSALQEALSSLAVIEHPKPPRRINIYEKLTFQSGAFRYDVSKNINPVIPSPVGEVTRKEALSSLAVIEHPKPPRRINIYEKLTFQSGAFRYDVSKNINPVIPSPVGEVTRKEELLLVLKDPSLPLHNNLSESLIREYVKRRKISGGTRSEAGRQSRDTFASSKKTCRLHGLSFWDYLTDRLTGSGVFPRLADLIEKASRVLPCGFCSSF